MVDRFGTCQLCLNWGELCNSHVIPNAVFRHTKQLHGSQLVSVDAGDSMNQLSQDSWSGYMLCKQCEQKIGPVEDYALTKLREAATKARPHRERGVAIENFDYKALKLFFTSLIWRAAVSKHDAYAKVNLPPKHREFARSSLFSQSAPDLTWFPCRGFTLFDGTGDTKTRLSADLITHMVMSPFSRRYKKYGAFLFIFGGYLFEMSLKLEREDYANPVILRRAKRWVLPPLDVFRIPEAVEVFMMAVAKEQAGHTRVNGVR